MKRIPAILPEPMPYSPPPGHIRKGDWIQTFTGRQFWPLDPFPSDFSIYDIAHGLANIGRFGGHLKVFYSVAQHSLFVSKWSPGRELEGLMHDAPETYIGDMVRPLKLHMPAFKQVEARIYHALAQAYYLPEKMSRDVKYADNFALVTEWDNFGTCSRKLWDPEVANIKSLGIPVAPMSPDIAEKAFLWQFGIAMQKRFEQLGLTGAADDFMEKHNLTSLP